MVLVLINISLLPKAEGPAPCIQRRVTHSLLGESEFLNFPNLPMNFELAFPMYIYAHEIKGLLLCWQRAFYEGSCRIMRGRTCFNY